MGRPEGEKKTSQELLDAFNEIARTLIAQHDKKDFLYIWENDTWYEIANFLMWAAKGMGYSFNFGSEEKMYKLDVEKDDAFGMGEDPTYLPTVQENLCYVYNLWYQLSFNKSDKGCEHYKEADGSPLDVEAAREDFERVMDGFAAKLGCEWLWKEEYDGYKCVGWTEAV